MGRVSLKLIEFFVFDYGSLPYLLSLFFWSEVTFPLDAIDKISKDDLLTVRWWAEANFGLTQQQILTHGLEYCSKEIREHYLTW